MTANYGTCDRCGDRQPLARDDRCDVCGPLWLCADCYASHRPNEL